MSDTPNASGIESDLSTQERIVPQSVRADGSVRRQRKVKPGFTPQEDVQRFRSKRVDAKRAKSDMPSGNVVRAALGLEPDLPSSPPSSGSASSALPPPSIHSSQPSTPHPKTGHDKFLPSRAEAASRWEHDAYDSPADSRPPSSYSSRYAPSPVPSPKKLEATVTPKYRPPGTFASKYASAITPDLKPSSSEQHSSPSKWSSSKQSKPAPLPAQSSPSKWSPAKQPKPEPSSSRTQPSPLQWSSSKQPPPKPEPWHAVNPSPTKPSPTPKSLPKRTERPDLSPAEGTPAIKPRRRGRARARHGKQPSTSAEPDQVVGDSPAPIASWSLEKPMSSGKFSTDEHIDWADYDDDDDFGVLARVSGFVDKPTTPTKGEDREDRTSKDTGDLISALDQMRMR